MITCKVVAPWAPLFGNRKLGLQRGAPTEGRPYISITLSVTSSHLADGVNRKIHCGEKVVGVLNNQESGNSKLLNQQLVVQFFKLDSTIAKRVAV